MIRKITYDSQGNDVTCMKEFDALKYPCRECNIKNCDEREMYYMRTMKLSDIKISEAFASSIPSERKMDECRNNWNEWHRQDRYIAVNHDNVLIDGYVMYLVLKENDIEEAKVKISNRNKKRWNRKNVNDWNAPHYRNEMTTYIYGIHPNSKEKKEYVWRVPKSWKGFENNLLPGDKIMVSTKYGVAPIIITKIEWLDKCPVDLPVKKVVRKIDYELQKFDCSNIDREKAEEILLVYACCSEMICKSCPWDGKVDCHDIYLNELVKEAVKVLMDKMK